MSAYYEGLDSMLLGQPVAASGSQIIKKLQQVKQRQPYSYPGRYIMQFELSFSD